MFPPPSQKMCYIIELLGRQERSGEAIQMGHDDDDRLLHVDGGVFSHGILQVLQEDSGSADIDIVVILICDRLRAFLVHCIVNILMVGKP